MRYKSPVIVVHGGAGSWRITDQERAKNTIKEALVRGFEEFKRGSAIEAVVEAIYTMEESGVFDAGKGSVKNSMGYIEMDAGIMIGNTLQAGGIMGLREGSAIKRALEILKQGRHVLMIDNSKVMHSTSGSVISGDTVGAVALDNEGNLVAGTSTGGISGKLPGRVGDSPIPGAGYYATTNVAVSSTGIGEIILKILPAKEVDILVSMGFSIEDSLRSVINKVTKIFGKDNIGMIGLDRYGNASAYYNTKGMARGVMSSEEVKVFVFEGEI
ncbi:arginase [Sulfolobus sp. E1]|uniref:isoaspartyl peptidase/L-asparaginase n=1 Tax=Saccharolobus sp. A20 TaxID=1891280 RepID=UPI00084605E4|nr:isoaspartyl peptidase/L-asparaginase [Sulfolobus sp. A20]TRM74326.1 arginase [Sulfolobus sp. A20-N-F8]TRM75664.1 arginase [Sulfolobus sp. E5]TRM79350.1 arginase [Sulfolobus sp. B5]TRM81325.1 arginase [Sulfolobus sp. D5]TRM89400.1 arginase [Sulfolobus sp. C3]TRM98912.1 arginase [Sulfolobus sp. E1]TRN00368.1 arginase [Sulfolobus sp. F1]